MKCRVARYRWFFYSEHSSDNPNSYGEIAKIPVLVTKGFFAREKTRNPVEILDSGASTSETQYVLIGQYNKHYKNSIRAGMFAYCPDLDEYVECLGDPIDLDGTRHKIHIFTVENIERSYTNLPT